MKIIVDRNEAIEIYDTEGELIFIHQPIDDEDIAGMTLDEQDAFVSEAIRDLYK
jgi:hypothetical protein